MPEKENEVIWCEVCGDTPYYISIHNENKSPQETLLCKHCYEDYESGKIDNDFDNMRDEELEQEYENL